MVRLLIFVLVGFTACFMSACGAGAKLHPDALMHNAEGTALLQEGKLDDAEARFRLALEYNARFSEPHANLGAVALEREDLIDAEAHLRQAIRLNLDFAEAHSNLGIVYERQGKHAAARDSYEEALSIQPGLVAARRNLAVSLVRADKIRAARAHLLRLVQITPDDPVAQSLLAYCDVRLERLDAAKTRVDNVLAEHPEESVALVVRGIVNAHQGEWANAEKDLEAGLGHPLVGDAARSRLVAVYAARGDNGSAWPLVKEMLREEPDDPAAHLVAGALRLQERRFSEARSHAVTVLRQRPDLEAAQDLLKQACANRGGRSCVKKAMKEAGR